MGLNEVSMDLRRRICVSTSILLLLVVCTGPAGAEWQTFDEYDGLADNFVNAILEDSSGVLWFGTGLGGGTTPGGVSRYDGVNWTTYTTDDGLAGKAVRAIVEDGSGALWLGTEGGVSRYDGVSWTTYTVADGLAGNYVYAILVDSSGALWFATATGVSRYDGVSWSTVVVPGGLADGVISILEDSSGALWFGKWGGDVSRYDGVSWRTYTEADGLRGNVLSIMEDSTGDLWFGTTSGVSRHDGVSWTTYTEADGLAHNVVTAIHEVSSGDLWFGTLVGVSRYDGVSWTTYTEADGLAGKRVRAILEDSSGALWFGTHSSMIGAGGGASRYDGVSWTTYTTGHGLAHNIVYEILEDSSGALWFGTYGGVSRYDGVVWTTFTESDGLADNYVRAIVEDNTGDLWFGGSYVSRYDGVSWRTYTTDDGLASNSVNAILVDSSGELWFGTSNGVSRYDGVSWTTYRAADGLGSNSVWAIMEDSTGDLWFGTGNGVSRYDGVGWTLYRTTDGLAGRPVRAIVEDYSGTFWFATADGVSRFDGESWTTYTEADGLADNYVRGMLQDSSGDLWFGTEGGLSRYDGVRWTSYRESDGLAHDYVSAILEDNSGAIWSGTSGGVTVHEPDRVAAQTVIWPKPPLLTSGTTMTVGFTAAFGESRFILFSHSLDGSPWSEWSSVDFWTGTDIADGEHLFAVRARDGAGNVDATPAVHPFEIDATAPSPVIASPVFEQAVRDSVLIVGTASDARFKDYAVEVRSAGTASWELLGESSIPVYEDVLAGWNTASVPDGFYEVRASVSDTLGLTGSVIVRVEVDNEAPWAHETAPAIVSTVTGGHVYTTNGKVHLYFPPHGFVKDTQVDIVSLVEGVVPDTLAGGAVRVIAGCEVVWDGVALGKPATMELSYGGLQSELPEGTLALYVFGADSTWRRLGGTVDGSKQSISSPVSEPGMYSLYMDEEGVAAGRSLSALSITPRVFSPSGGYAARTAAVGFTLGRPGPVTVKIYNRAGRLVSEVASGKQLNAGANLVHWDGRGRNGALVDDGVYLVTVEALGQKQVKPLAVVR